MGSIRPFVTVNAFDPEMTQAMSAAMDSAWQQLAASGRVETMPYRASVTKERMATAILHEARKGVPDAQKFVAAAMMVILSEARFPAAQGHLPPVRSSELRP
jgi:hypothetical protein